MTPIILLCGESGSGKDTVSEFLAKNHKAQPTAFADPMKRFAMKAFGFTEDQLWGPSSSRNTLDTRFASASECNAALDQVEGLAGWNFANELGALSHLGELKRWAFNLLKEAQEGEAKGLTPRKTLQTLGTEWGRHVDSDMWVKYALKTAREILHQGAQYSRTLGIWSYGSAPDFVVISDGRFRNEILTLRELGASVWKIRSSTNTTTATAGVANHKSETEQRTIPDFYYTQILDNDKTAGLQALERTVDLAMSSIRDYNLKPEWYSTRVTALRGW